MKQDKEERERLYSNAAAATDRPQSPVMSLWTLPCLSQAAMRSSINLTLPTCSRPLISCSSAVCVPALNVAVPTSAAYSACVCVMYVQL